MVNDLVTVSVVHFIWMHFPHHLFLIIVCCSHIIGLSIEWSACSVLVRVIHLICIVVKVSSFVNNIDVIVVEHLSIVIILFSFLLLMLLAAGLTRCATLSSLHVHKVVLDITIKLNVQLAADIANHITNFVEVLSFVDIVILKVVQKLLLVLICCTIIILFSAKAEYFSIFFLIVWGVSLVIIIL